MKHSSFWQAAGFAVSTLVGTLLHCLYDWTGESPLVAVFSGVERGLYLLEQTQRMDGFYPFRPFLAEVPSGGQWRRCYEPAVLPITDEPPCTGDVMVYLAVLGMALSGGGLVCCGIWNRKNGGGLSKP